MRELFIDCSSGVAGDMLSAALFELCEDRSEMLEKLNSFGIPGVEYIAEKTVKHSVSGTHLTVKYMGCEEEQGGEKKPHKHGMSLPDVNIIVDSLNMPEKVKTDVRAVYNIIAEAESEVHGCKTELVHFHELGTMDAIADISAACFIADSLDVSYISSTPICTGFGEFECSHGILDVPAPATALILKEVPNFAGDMEGELCTPTGAALIKYLAQDFTNAPAITPARVGCGMGKKNFPKLSAVRASICENEEAIIELCCNVDDMSPEAVGFAIDEFLRRGAKDAYYETIGMKKNRPGLLLTCLCGEDSRDKMVELIFKHTSTIGIRETLCRRYVLKREEKTVTTAYGKVRVKCSSGYGVSRKKAEYDDLARIAREKDVSISEIKKLAEISET